MALADTDKRSTAKSNGQPVHTGLAATLREAGPGVVVCFELADGNEVTGAVGALEGDRVKLEGGGREVDLRQVKRVRLEFSSAPKRKRRRSAQR